VARMVETRNAYKMLVGKSDGICSTYNGGERRMAMEGKRVRSVLQNKSVGGLKWLRRLLIR
jgi:hypothetical protein